MTGFSFRPTALTVALLVVPGLSGPSVTAAVAQDKSVCIIGSGQGFRGAGSVGPAFPAGGPRLEQDGGFEFTAKAGCAQYDLNPAGTDDSTPRADAANPYNVHINASGFYTAACVASALHGNLVGTAAVWDDTPGEPYGPTGQEFGVGPVAAPAIPPAVTGYSPSPDYTSLSMSIRVNGGKGKVSGGAVAPTADADASTLNGSLTFLLEPPLGSMPTDVPCVQVPSAFFYFFGTLNF
jgi:hypothetical protein